MNTVVKSRFFNGWENGILGKFYDNHGSVRENINTGNVPRRLLQATHSGLHSPPVSVQSSSEVISIRTGLDRFVFSYISIG